MFRFFEKRKEKALAKQIAGIIYFNANKAGCLLNGKISADLANSKKFISAIFAFVDKSSCLRGIDTLTTLALVLDNIFDFHSSQAALKLVKVALLSDEGGDAAMDVHQHLNSLKGSSIPVEEGMTFLVEYMR